jgi:hypothetical protein
MPNSLLWTSSSNGSFNTAGNWYNLSAGTAGTDAPGNGDTLYWTDAGGASVTSNLTTILTTVTAIVEQSYGGQIGVYNSGLFTPLTFDGGTAFIGQRSGGPGTQSGSSMIALNFGTTAATVTVHDSCSTGAGGNVYPPVLIDGTVLTLRQFGGRVGVAVEPGTASTLADARVTGGSGSNVSPELYVGRGGTMTALWVSGGARAFSRSTNTVAAANAADGGEYVHQGTGLHTQLTLRQGGICRYEGTGTVNGLDIYNGGVFDRTRNSAPLIIATLTFQGGGGSLLLDNGVTGATTITNAITFNGCGIQDVKITLPDLDTAIG